MQTYMSSRDYNSFTYLEYEVCASANVGIGRFVLIRCGERYQCNDSLRGDGIGARLDHC